MIYVGLVLNGPERLPVALEGAIADLRESMTGLDTGSSDLDLVLIFGGSLIEAPFQGVRVGRLSRAKRILQVQAAMSREDVQSAQAPRLVLSLARQAVAQAAEVLASAGLEFDPDSALGRLPSATATMVHPTKTLALKPVLEVHLSGLSATETGRIEDLIVAALHGKEYGELDGHEIGGGSTVMFIYGDLDRVTPMVISVLKVAGAPPSSFLVGRDPNRDTEVRTDLDLERRLT